MVGLPFEGFRTPLFDPRSSVDWSRKYQGTERELHEERTYLGITHDLQEIE